MAQFIIAAYVVATAAALCSAFPHDVPKRVLVCGDSNAWGGVPIAESFSTKRLSYDERFAVIMQSNLDGG